ncbi:MAG: hypothetical protein NC043_07535 [Muribaculaceae bacterium]|nr:hypothetical protein [Muribaculaceae bacterium]
MKPVIIKNIFALAAACGIVGSVSAINLTPSININPVRTLAASDSPTAYYYTPMGMTFSGIDKTGNFDGDYAYAPVSFRMQTAAEVTGGTIEWKYPTGLNTSGTETFGTSTSQEFSFRMTQAGRYSTPVLSCINGSNTVQYCAANDGIIYGSLGSDSHFAVNYQPNQMTEFGTASEILNVNDASASAMLNMVMAGGLYSDIKLYGFAESFYYSKDFWLEAINCEISSKTTPALDDIAVKVFRREQTSVYTDEVATLTPTDIYAMGNDRYFVTFTCSEPTLITTAMQVVVLPAEGNKISFSMVMPLQKSYHASNAGTASLYADFSLLNKPVKKQYIDFYGTEVTNDDDTSAGFLNNWAIGIKGSYEKPAAINAIDADPTTADDDSIYNLHGVKVGSTKSDPSLPAGIYISGGKKIIVH